MFGDPDATHVSRGLLWDSLCEEVMNEAQLSAAQEMRYDPSTCRQVRFHEQLRNKRQADPRVYVPSSTFRCSSARGKPFHLFDDACHTVVLGRSSRRHVLSIKWLCVTDCHALHVLAAVCLHASLHEECSYHDLHVFKRSSRNVCNSGSMCGWRSSVLALCLGLPECFDKEQPFLW